jgi:hypothetical protein
MSRRRKLPADPEKMNDRRAAWAGAALDEFARLTGCDKEDSLGDLLADLGHWADRNDYDFDAAAFRGHGHYLAETGQDVSRLPWLRREPGGKSLSDEMADALELCVDALETLARSDDGTPSISALFQARDALAKAGR